MIKCRLDRLAGHWLYQIAPTREESEARASRFFKRQPIYLFTSPSITSGQTVDRLGTRLRPAPPPTPARGASPRRARPLPPASISRSPEQRIPPRPRRRGTAFRRAALRPGQAGSGSNQVALSFLNHDLQLVREFQGVKHPKNVVYWRLLPNLGDRRWNSRLN